ncbi:MAG TPA: nucleoside phosphorylase [Anaerolineales bacterium]|nr:nucleoside phosphorylase [Anaerolineales bacterium]
MKFPIYPDKHKLIAMVTAEQMMDFRRKQGGLGETKAPETVILCLYKGVMKYFPLKYPSKRVKGFLGDLYLIKKTGGRVAVMGNFGIGSPVVANLAEEMAAWGAGRLVLLSLSGGLQTDLSPGSIVVCDRAIRDEGTSYHYLPPDKYVNASSELVAHISTVFDSNGLQYSIGGTWSTDAPYRESREEAESFQSEGILTVDMESAGLFAVGQIRGVQVSSVFVVGDSLANPRWSTPPDMRVLHEKLKFCLRVLVGL